jgi:hypothetical protein
MQGRVGARAHRSFFFTAIYKYRLHIARFRGVPNITEYMNSYAFTYPLIQVSRELELFIGLGPEGRLGQSVLALSFGALAGQRIAPVQRAAFSACPAQVLPLLLFSSNRMLLLATFLDLASVGVNTLLWAWAWGCAGSLGTGRPPAPRLSFSGVFFFLWAFFLSRRGQVGRPRGGVLQRRPRRPVRVVGRVRGAAVARQRRRPRLPRRNRPLRRPPPRPPSFRPCASAAVQGHAWDFAEYKRAEPVHGPTGATSGRAGFFEGKLTWTYRPLCLVCARLVF